MQAAVYHLTVEQGAPFSKTITLQVPSSSVNLDLVPMNLNGYTGSAQIREQWHLPNALATFAVTFPSGSTTLPTGSVASQGRVTIDLTLEQVNSMPAWVRGVWDLFLTPTGGSNFKVLYGEVWIIPRVTR
jgi:non-ribosomal peptide synthetase component F